MDKPTNSERPLPAHDDDGHEDHTAALNALRELLNNPSAPILQCHWVSSAWGETQFGSESEGKFVSLCSPSLVRHLLEHYQPKCAGITSTD
jgi:hypothetical protein